MNDRKVGLPRYWIAACAVLLVFFAFSRLSDLSSRPLHHDEGVNSIFMKDLVTRNDWKYDPANYHGPSLYYIHLPAAWITGWLREGFGAGFHSPEGLTPTSLRAPVGIAGLLVLLGILAMTPSIGRLGAFVAFVLAGFSCNLLFFSRYFIHETYVVLFNLGIILSFERYYATQSRKFIYLAVLSAALLFCTKETSIVHFGILALAWVCAETSKWLIEGRTSPAPFERMSAEPSRLYSVLGPHATAAMVIGIIVWALLYSSFGTNPRGMIDSLRTYFFWGGEGFESGHVKPFLYYASDLLLRYEAPLVVGTVVGLFVAFAKADRTGLFLAFWTMGTIGFYSLIPYKTPWLIENFIVPMALLSGYGVQGVVRAAIDHLGGWRAGAALAAFSSGLFFVFVAQMPMTFRVVYKEYDSDRHPQVYAHTVRDIYGLVAGVDAAAVRSGLGRNMKINIFSNEYWPLPFYLARYESALFWGQVETSGENLDAPVLIALPAQREKLDGLLKDSYEVSSHNLRPGVPLLLYVNQNLTGAQAPPATPIDLLTSTKAPAKPVPGLVMEAYRGTTFSGQPIRVKHGDADWNFNWEDDNQKPFRAPFGLRWTGYLHVEQEGPHRFSLNSDDGSWLIIDGETVIDNGGDHAAIKLSRTANLSKGYHSIELRYFDSLGGALLDFRWSRPGAKDETVPMSAVFHAGR